MKLPQSGSGKAIVIFGVLALLFTIVMALMSVNAKHAFVIPGFPANNFKSGSKVVLQTNKITSEHTQIPYNYHDLPVCHEKDLPPKDASKTEHVHTEQENLGQVILGDRLETSLYQLHMLKDIACKTLCSKQLDKKAVATFRERIRDEYKIHWLVDQLPSASKLGKPFLPSEELKKLEDPDGDVFAYEMGFNLGQKERKEGEKAFAHLNNHVDIIVHYHEIEPGKYRIVFFEVTPKSIDYKSEADIAKCAAGSHAPLDLTADSEKKVFFTYSVKWVSSHIKWAERWDKYLTSMRAENQIHWFAIINSLMIVLFLSGMVAMIMVSTLNADFIRYNAQDADEPDETGWKLVHKDVFRAPRFPMLFSVLIGSGMQVTGMLVIVMVFAVLGVLSPANSGALMMAMLVLFVWMGILAGYCSTRMYKNLGGDKWKRNALMTAFFFPGIFFGTFFFLSCFLWGKHSSGGIPFTSFMALIALWFGISVPLCFFGSYFAWRQDKAKEPCAPTLIPRQIPKQVWYMHPIFSILMGGILPFGAVFIELFFILSSIWKHQFYYLFGFLFLVFLILIVTCAEITIVMCYFQLCSEDYHWWWRSYLTSGASAFYMFLYATYYFITRLQFSTFVSVLLYFGYSFMMCFAFFVCTGAVGFYSCYWFVRKIYGSVKFA